MTDVILILNAGSSSIKFALYPAPHNGSTPLITGKIAGIKRDPVFQARGSTGCDLSPGTLAVLDVEEDQTALTRRLLCWIEEQTQESTLVAVGHRVVHGGQRFTGPVLLNEEIIGELEKLQSLAPLHQPYNLSAIALVSSLMPDVPQIACFDTSFHRTQPRLAQLFPLPRQFADDGILRYGFHGLSYDYIASVLPDYLKDKSEGRVIVAHLGNGASMCAMKNRQSVATSMGFTALDGLMMGSRPGSLDVGVVLHLIQEQSMKPADIQDLLYTKSGLLGVSGISNNMQVLLESLHPHAQEAVDLFCYRAAAELGALLPALGGLDAIIFTAGIGEKAPLVRKQICSQLAWLGLCLDEEENAANATVISAPNSSIDVLVIPTNEEEVIAAATYRLVTERAV
ncbi:acetate/propionate family kinase [Sneathiella sp.]|uniref:acetate/propionate family kinase n=1 Tax=Sneathiella sp. TaxID=1964365 RepID=UPI00260729D8|nr:acetate/propionate family kinase [Sneathiella sp.]MDF2368181.1 acetate/propionate family kinase [Sneathiella sp.]